MKEWRSCGGRRRLIRRYVDGVKVGEGMLMELELGEVCWWSFVGRNVLEKGVG